MEERILSAFDPFVIPFMFGMVFVLAFCIVGLFKILAQLSFQERKQFFISLITPITIFKNIRDIFCDCLIHVKLWRRNKLLGYMHSSIAFGWFMIILIGHIETFFYIPERAYLFYYPIFFRYFVSIADESLRGGVFFFAMDLFLLIILSGIVLAMYKRVHSRALGMRRTTRLTMLDLVGLYSLWAIFPCRLIAEGFTAGVSGGSFLTAPTYKLFAFFIDNPENFTIAWWCYSLVLGVFLTVLPFTRYMHIPAEILLIPMRNAGLKVTHSKKGFALAQVYSCPSCGLCIDACPMGARKKNNKYATIYFNRWIKRDREEKALVNADRCLMCGKCQAVCPIGISAVELRRLVRASRKCNINQDYSYLATIEPEVISGKKVLYYGGCMTALTPIIPHSVDKLLKAADIDYSIMDKDGSICCGRPLMLAGKVEEAKALIAKNTEIIMRSGAQILLVSCAICYRVFKEEYNLKGIKVMHYTEYFNQLLNEGVLKVRHSNEKIVYHDPCDLGRGCGIYEQPREALRYIAELVPATKEKRESVCCGGSVGSLSLSLKERGYITESSIKNLMANSPSAIITACPLCLKTFARLSPIPVKDFAQCLSEKLGGE